MTLRADAQRNLDRLLDVAGECFAEQGLDVSVDEIARRAGVGHGTVFRNFPSKDDLVIAVLNERIRSSPNSRLPHAPSQMRGRGSPGSFGTSPCSTPRTSR